LFCGEPTTKKRKETEMDTKAAIAELKKRIKLLSAVQKKAKRARKTKIPKAEYIKLKKEVMGSSEAEWSPEWDVLRRRIEITATLNLYNELRGKEACHGIRKGLRYLYEKYAGDLKSSFKLVNA